MDSLAGQQHCMCADSAASVQLRMSATKRGFRGSWNTEAPHSSELFTWVLSTCSRAKVWKAEVELLCLCFIPSWKPTSSWPASCQPVWWLLSADGGFQPLSLSQLVLQSCVFLVCCSAYFKMCWFHSSLGLKLRTEALKRWRKCPCLNHPGMFCPARPHYAWNDSFLSANSNYSCVCAFSGHTPVHCFLSVCLSYFKHPNVTTCRFLFKLYWLYQSWVFCVLMFIIHFTVTLFVALCKNNVQ